MIPRTTMMMMVTLLMLICGGVDGMGQDTWVKVLGGEKVMDPSITKTSDGGILITRSPFCTVDLESEKGDVDILIMSLDSYGRILWSRSIGGTESDYCKSITTTSDGDILITGSTESIDGDFKGKRDKRCRYIFVMKLDKDGRIQWTKTFGGSRGGSELGESLIALPDGTVLVTGHFPSDDGDFKGMNKGEIDIFVMKLDTNGDVLWRKTFGGSSYEYGSSLSTTEDGGIFLTGYSESNDGDFKGMYRGVNQIPETGSNEFASWRSPLGDIYVIKLDNNGSNVWIKSFGGIKHDGAISVRITSENDVVIAGNFGSNDGDFKGMNKGESDFFVMKLDTNGDVLWKKTFGGTSTDYGSSLTTTFDGGVLITGWTNSNDGDFEGMNKGGWDIFLIKLNSNGEILWKKTFGGTSTDSGSSLTTTEDDGIVLTGSSESNDGDFKGMYKGKDGIFVMKLDSNGNLKPSGKRKSKKK